MSATVRASIGRTAVLIDVTQWGATVGDITPVPPAPRILTIAECEQMAARLAGQCDDRRWRHLYILARIGHLAGRMPVGASVKVEAIA